MLQTWEADKEANDQSILDEVFQGAGQRLKYGL
jgi:hypothetical protein